MPGTSTPTQEHDFFRLDHLQSVAGNRGWYSNQKFLGKGGNGTVFLVTATDGPFFGVQFALKVFHKISDSIRRNAFLAEIEHLESMSHPAIVKVIDRGEYNLHGHSYPFVVVDYAPKTARQLIERGGMERIVAVRYGMHCLSALQALHAHPKILIHRDIKPENIFVSDSVAKLGDFGLVKALATQASDEEPYPYEQTQWPGMPFGYRTPEMVRRAQGQVVQLTTSTDVYQMGTVLCELLTGKNPQKWANAITDDIELQIPYFQGYRWQGLKDLIAEMLSTDPSQRPTARQCLERLNYIHKDLCEEYSRLSGTDH